MSLTWVILVFAIVFGNVKSYLITKDIQKPALYKLDNYEECMNSRNRQSSSVYCLVKVAIQPNNNSEIWRAIQHYSKDTRQNLRHDHLDRGICITNCEELVKSVGKAKQHYAHPSEINNWSSKYFPATRNYNQKYNSLITQCVNHELEMYDNLTASSEIEYCVSTSDTTTTSYDWLDILFILLFGTLICVNISSTIYDLRLKRNKTADQFSTTMQHKWTMLFVSFSLPRNIRSLFSEKNNQIAKDLRFIHGVRIFLVVTVIWRHSFVIIHTLPAANPEKLEEIFNSINIAWTDCIRFFFILSSFLLTVLFLDETRNNNVNVGTFSYFRKGIIDRYIRLTPIYAFIILFRATLMNKMGDGPVWNRFMTVAQTNCRKNWWTNLLFINNYVNANESCSLENWYLATDLQLFIVAHFIRILIWKYPRLTKYILSSGIALSYIIVSCVTYMRDLKGIVDLSLLTHTTSLVLDKSFLEAYTPTHMQLGNVFIGILAAIIYFNLRERNFIPNTFWIILWYFNFLLILVNTIIIAQWNLYNFEMQTWWSAACVACLRHTWSWTFSVVLIGLALRMNNILAKVYDWIICIPLAKITYCIYLCHYTIMPVILYRLREPPKITSMTLHHVGIVTLILSTLISFVLCLCVELPIASVHKYFQNKDESKKKTE